MEEGTNVKTADYIDRLRPLTKTGSDYAVARLLEVSDATVNHYAKGRRYLDNYAAIRVAELLDIDPLKVIAHVEIEREKGKVRRARWTALAKKLVCSALPTGVIAIGHSGHSEASKPDARSTELGDTVQIMRHLWGAIRRRFGMKTLALLQGSIGFYPRTAAADDRPSQSWSASSFAG